MNFGEWLSKKTGKTWVLETVILGKRYVLGEKGETVEGWSFQELGL